MEYNDFKDKFKERMNKALDKIASKEKLQPIADQLQEDIRLRTVVGDKGVENGKPKTFKKLADSTLESRIDKEIAGKLSKNPKTKWNRSHLTETGDMVNSLHNITTDKNIKITVKANQVNKAKWNEEKGRTFLEITDKQEKQLHKKLETALINEINKSL